jgi:hypothetical protein
MLQFNGSLWQQIGQNLPTNTEFKAHPSIVFSYNYDPLIRWIAYRSEGNIITGKLVSGGTDWHAVSSVFEAADGADVENPEVYAISDALALATSGEQAYLATIRKNDRHLIVLHDAGSGWVQLGTDASPGTANRPALVLADGQPVLAFRDNNQDGRLSVRRYSGTTWENLGSPGFSASPVKSVALACSPGRRLFAACVENNRVGIYRFDAGSWRAIGPTNTRAGDRISLVLAGEEPWVAYADLAHDYQATVLRGR